MKSKRLGEYWHECARCGNTFPESMMQKSKKGKWICLKICWDSGGEKEDQND